MEHLRNDDHIHLNTFFSTKKGGPKKGRRGTRDGGQCPCQKRNWKLIRDKYSEFFIGRPHRTRSIRIGEICCLGTPNGKGEKILATAQIVSSMVQ